MQTRQRKSRHQQTGSGNDQGWFFAAAPGAHSYRGALSGSVELFGAGCSPYFAKGTCTYDLVARIDAGVALPKANQIYGANGVTLTSSTDPNCSFVAGADQCWHGNLTLPADAGPTPITITWEETTGQVQLSKLEDCTDKGGNKCKGDFGVDQRAYGARDTTSGPIQLLKLFNCDGDPSCTVSDRQRSFLALLACSPGRSAAVAPLTANRPRDFASL